LISLVNSSVITIVSPSCAAYVVQAIVANAIKDNVSSNFLIIIYLHFNFF